MWSSVICLTAFVGLVSQNSQCCPLDVDLAKIVGTLTGWCGHQISSLDMSNNVHCFVSIVLWSWSCVAESKWQQILSASFKYPWFLSLPTICRLFTYPPVLSKLQIFQQSLPCLSHRLATTAGENEWACLLTFRVYSRLVADIMMCGLHEVN